MSRLDEIRARNEAARAEYTTSEPDQTVRDTDYLLGVIDRVQKLAEAVPRFVVHGGSVSGIIQADRILEAITPRTPTESPIMPRGSWLWPDAREGMEWADKHDERL